MYEDVDAARGGRIAALRGDRLMTQAAFATAASLHVGTVRRAEAGRPLSAETAQALCAVLGLPPHGLAAVTDATSADATVGLASTVREGQTVPAPRPGRPEWLAWATRCGIGIAIVCALGAAILESVAWMTDEPLWFRILQAAAQTCLATVLLIAVVNRLTRTRRKVWGLALALSAAACAWPSVQVIGSLNQTALDVMKSVKDYSRENGVIHVRTIIDTAWDPSESRWKMMRQFTNRLGSTVAYLQTPGTYAWHERRAIACRDMFLHAEAYPKDVCDPVRQPLRETLAVDVWKSVIGGSFVADEYAAATSDDVVGGGDFARARQVYDEVTRLVAGGIPKGISYADRVREVDRAVATARVDPSPRHDP